MKVKIWECLPNQPYITQDFLFTRQYGHKPKTSLPTSKKNMQAVVVVLDVNYHLLSFIINNLNLVYQFALLNSLNLLLSSIFSSPQQAVRRNFSNFILKAIVNIPNIVVTSFFLCKHRGGERSNNNISEMKTHFSKDILYGSKSCMYHLKPSYMTYFCKPSLIVKHIVISIKL